MHITVLPGALFDDFEEAILDLFCGPLDDAIAASQRPRNSAECLVRLIEERDRLTAQLQTMATACEAIPEPMLPIMGLFDTAFIAPVRAQLQMIEEEISAVQRDLESSATLSENLA